MVKFKIVKPWKSPHFPSLRRDGSIDRSAFNSGMKPKLETIN